MCGSRGVLDPLNVVDDRNGAFFANDVVKTAPGWIAVYRQFVDGGWNALPCPLSMVAGGLSYAVVNGADGALQIAEDEFKEIPI
ncbi:protein of unknown function [Georgfuchsia toluolica]|uniref:Uncharacterized protein n=1 Tax=Georgfuchsia toluolica TaxID=424218 RepID=A0A916J1L2_9PROT|nr:hypothetical protein [Georgfuchsia toluolica]CAG4882329.1 protein of unknown function [Georgfuchsia toluolica]